MRPLPDSFTSDGFNFTLAKRAGNVALFAKRKPNYATDTFEVVIVQERPAVTFKGHTTPEREAMPGSEQWGTAGWSYQSRKDAEAKFDSLVNRTALPKGVRKDASEA